MAFGIGFTFGLYIASLRYIEATAAAVLIFLAPFLTAAIAREPSRALAARVIANGRGCACTP